MYQNLEFITTLSCQIVHNRNGLSCVLPEYYGNFHTSVVLDIQNKLRFVFVS
jgi:succinate dehydrogenase hydrophobic anchor subunit